MQVAQRKFSDCPKRNPPSPPHSQEIKGRQGHEAREGPGESPAAFGAEAVEPAGGWDRIYMSPPPNQPQRSPASDSPEVQERQAGEALQSRGERRGTLGQHGVGAAVAREARVVSAQGVARGCAQWPRRVLAAYPTSLPPCPPLSAGCGPTTLPHVPITPLCLFILLTHSFHHPPPTAFSHPTPRGPSGTPPF